MFILVLVVLTAMGLATFCLGSLPMTRHRRAFTAVGSAALGVSVAGGVAALAYGGWTALV